MPKGVPAYETRRLDIRAYFFAFNGPGPFKCGFCGGLVYAPWDTPHLPRRHRDVFSIDHADGDKENNDLSNLRAAHGGCNSADGARRIRNEEARRKKIKQITANRWRTGSLQGHEQTDETRAKISAGLKAAYAEGRR